MHFVSFICTHPIYSSHPQDHTPPSSPSPHLSRRSPPDTHQPKDNQKPHSVPYLDTRPTQPQQPPVQQPLAYSYSPPAYYIDSRWVCLPLHPSHPWLLSDPISLPLSLLDRDHLHQHSPPQSSILTTSFQIIQLSPCLIE